VFWIGRRPGYRLLNDNTAWVLQLGKDNGFSRPIHDHGLYGEDQVIAMLDTGLDADMKYFRDPALGLPVTNIGMGVGTPDPNHRKVLIYNFLWDQDDPADPTDWDDHDHGTHVAGIAAGDDLAGPGLRDHGDGMALRAKLVIQDGGMETDDCADIPAIGCPAADLQPFFDQARLQGASIHSNSWGDRENFTPINIYSDGSEDADAFMWAHPEFLILFAAGNEGSSDDTVISPATAKNVIAVGSTAPGLNAGNIPSNSSRGNTADDRIKPDVMAPGSSILSADNDNDITTNNGALRSMSGTSMATPAVAGAAALIREYYQKGYFPGGTPEPADGFTPTAALLKATLIGSAHALEGLSWAPPPNKDEGWGRVLLDDALYFTGDDTQLFVHDETAGFSDSGELPAEFDIEVVDSSRPFKVTLVWTDYPSTPVAALNLVNHLNLELVAPDATVYLGNNFVDGFTVPGGTPDLRNNIEVVNLMTPQTGTWTVRVIPMAIPQPAQGFALTAVGRIARGGSALFRSDIQPAPVGGNMDDILEPGEWFDLPLELIGSGLTTATGVQASLVSLTPQVTVSVSLTTYPDLPVGSMAMSAPNLQFHLATDFPCSREVELELTWQADGFTRTELLTYPTGTKNVFLTDDFEGSANWTHVATESTATTGMWTIDDPNPTLWQPGNDTTPDPGVLAFFTALNPQGNDNDGDVDGGVMVGRSGPYNLDGHPEAHMDLNRWFASWHHGADSEDFFRLEIREDQNADDILMEELDTWVAYPQWNTISFRVADYVVPGQNVGFRVSASDGPAHENRLEAAIDDIVFWDPVCAAYDPVPGAVTTLTVNKDSADLRLNWNRPAEEPAFGGATGYRVYRSETATGGYALLDDFTDVGATLTWVDSGAGGESPVAYHYEVIAYNPTGESEILP